MSHHNIRLSSPEIGGLWETYIQETMSVCLLKYFLHHLKDDEIKTILQQALDICSKLVPFFLKKLSPCLMDFRMRILIYQLHRFFMIPSL